MGGLMSDKESTSSESPGRGVVYDLARRRRGRRGGDPARPGESLGPRPADETSEARAKRVAELKAQIAAGAYHPDPEEVARKMLERGFPG
jgi:hypothetical protein